MLIPDAGRVVGQCGATRHQEYAARASNRTARAARTAEQRTITHAASSAAAGAQPSRYRGTNSFTSVNREIANTSVVGTSSHANRKFQGRGGGAWLFGRRSTTARN